MNINHIILLIVLLAALTTGCRKPEERLPEDFEISSGAAQFDAETNTFYFEWERQSAIIEITATGWQAFVPTIDGWCTFGREGSQMILTVAENSCPYESRSTFVQFSLGNETRRIEVYQRRHRILHFEENATAMTTTALEDNYSIPLVTTIPEEDLTISLANPVDWITDLRFEFDNIVFNTTRNTSPNRREATIIISGDHRTATMHVTQNAIGLIVGADINQCPTHTVVLSIEGAEWLSSIQWYKDETPVAGATDATYTVTETGIYTVSSVFGGNTRMSLPKEVTIIYCPNPEALIYEDFLGTYTMWFHQNTETPPPPGMQGAPRQNSVEVTIEVATSRGGYPYYYLKGVLAPADEALGNIIMKYNSETMCMELWGQKLFQRASGERPSFWLSPEGVTTTVSRARSNPTNAVERGVASARHSVSEIGDLVFELNHIPGTWGTTTATGVHLQNFTDDEDIVNGSDVRGAQGIPTNGRVSHMFFERIKN